MSVKEPLVSFVVPVYKKSPGTFKRCLDSLFDQSLKEFEVICVFDGPNEELEAVARTFPRVQRHVIEHGGACKARNHGSSLASGKYLFCWDADCFIKPDHAKRMLEEFDAVPDADFVYSGYEVDGNRGGSDGEPFSAYSLTCGNYISSMAPIKREKAPKWDESLKGAQDWDFWLTAVENGCKGAFVPGSGFITEPSGEGSISQDAWSNEKREETMRIVREKHGIPERTGGVYSATYPERALRLAEILGYDYIKTTGRNPETYKTILNFGYSQVSRWQGIKDDVTKIQYWLAGEISGLESAQYRAVMETIRISKTCINLCNTQFEQNRLKELGIEAQVVSLPVAKADLKKVETSLPKDFSILVLVDEAYGKLLKELAQDLPHVKFGLGAGKTKEYSAVMSFYLFAALDDPIIMAQVNGRNVISNVQAPYCGFIDPSLNWDEFKKELYQKIREIRTKPFNKEAQDHYVDLVDPDKFRESILKLSAVELGVVA